MSKYKNIFNRDFYPTPKSVLDLMMIDFKGETVLEPSAGKGNIIDYAKDHGAKDIMFCEINDELSIICKTKARFLKSDFLKVTSEEISHISLIVMNPPFSNAATHIQHAWGIAPQGCQIVSLCNSANMWDWRYKKSELKNIIEENGNTIELGNVFNEDAERKTDVKVTCIKLFKPILNDSMNFEGFYLDAEPEYINKDGIVKHNEIQALVNSYIGAVKCFDEFSAINDKMIRLCSPVGMGGGFSYEISYNKNTCNKETFAKELQRHCWQHIFSKMRLNKYLTSGVMEDVNKFVEQQTKVPFTVKNVFRMLEIIVGTAEHNFKRALVEAVEAFTKHTHENRYNVEGWKTNDAWMLNEKFIVPYLFETRSWDKGRLTFRYSSNSKMISDLEKVLCNITGTNYDDMRCLEVLVSQFNGLEPNRWYCNGFFEVKGFKKGTAHFKFQNRKHWELLNRKYGEIKGFVLHEYKEETTYQQRQTGRKRPKAAKTAVFGEQTILFQPKVA